MKTKNYTPETFLAGREKFKAGDTVKCLESKKFADGTYHLKGGAVQIKEENQYYFFANHEEYEKI